VQQGGERVCKKKKKNNTSPPPPQPQQKQQQQNKNKQTKNTNTTSPFSLHYPFIVFQYLLGHATTDAAVNARCNATRQ
jgi:hypothetical protein